MSQDAPVPAPAAPPRRADLVTRLLIILSVLVTIVLGGLLFAQRQGWTLDKPVVIGITPREGGRDVSGKQPVAVSFNIPMDRDTAQAALKVDPPTDGEFTWDGTTMVWTPKVGYQRGTTYTVEVETTARSPLFQGLGAAVGTTFRTAGLPSVYRVVPPADAVDVVTDTTISIQFSQPMIPLTTLDAQPEVGDKITITPAIDGQWKWLGTTALGFVPTGGLRPATRYTVQVRKTFTDLAGGELERDFSWSFTTPRPRVVSVAPVDQTRFIAPESPVVVRFNQAVDPASAQSGLKLDPAVAGAFAWSPASDVLTFTPASRLPLDTPYRATMGGVRSALGDLPQSEAYNWTFRTTALARVVGTQPQEGGTIGQSDNVRISYSAPLSATQKELLAAVHLSPPARGMNVYTYDEDTQLAVYAPLAPSTAYTLTVDGTLHDRTGALVPGTTLHFRSPSLPPFAYLLNQSGVSTFYAGAPTRVYLDVVNVSKVTVRLYRLDSSQIVPYIRSAQTNVKFTASGAPLRSWDLAVDPTPNRRQALRPNLALDGASDRLPPGFYFVEVSAPEVAQPSSTAIVVGRTALTLKSSGKEYWLWAVDMGTGQPVANRRVRAVNDVGETLGEATTDQDGVARIDNAFRPEQGTPIAVMDDGDAALISPDWSNGIASYNFDFSTYGLSGDMQGTIYTERPIYRPGQKIFFKGILRNDDDGRYSVPAGLQVPVDIRDGNGNEVFTQTMTLTEFGTFSGEYTLGPDVPLGSWNIGVNLPDRQAYIRAEFQVQEYRKPEYLVGVTAAQPSVVNGDKIAATVQASYFFGGPVARAEVRQRVLSSDYYFQWTDPDSKLGYEFQDYQALFDRFQSFQGSLRTETTATTDADGRVAWEVPTNIGDEPLSQQFTLEAGVRDTSNQEVSANTQVIVHKGEFYVGLRTDSYVNAVDQPLTVHVQTVGADATRRGNVPVEITFFRREWEQVDEQDESGLLVTRWKPKDTALAGGPVTTDAQGRAQVAFTPKEAGEYRAYAVARDGRGNTVTSATYTWVSDPADTDEPISWRQENESRIEMVADKAEYQPGDTARILVTSPFTNAVGLLTVERGRLREHRVVQLQGGSPVLEVPIPADYLPNVYLGLSVIAPADTNRGGQPAFRQGYVPLPVSTASKDLQIEIKPSAERLHPRDTVTYTITTRDAAGKPVAAELSLAVVDKAIYSLADDNAPRLMDNFYGNRALSFNTASSLLVLNSLLQPAEGGPAGKGGGGGARAGGADDFIRADFRDVAYWQADVTTDASGTAQVAVRLPDNLTTWRLTALAITGETLVGAANNEVVVNKDLLVRPISPRFLMVHDQAEPGAVVHNYTNQPWTVEVTLALSRSTFVEGGPAEAQRVEIPANGEATVHWQIQAGSAATTTLTMTARAVGSPAGDNPTPPSDSVSFVLPVKPFLAPEAVATSGEVAGDTTAQEQVFVPHGVDPGVGDLTIQVSPSLAATTGTGVTYLEEWPYQSTEETVSRFYPLVVLDRAYSAAGRKAPFADGLRDIVERSLQRLYRTQHYRGGWCWYECQLEIDAPPSAWLTAYAFQGLSAAKAAGYTVSDRVLDQAHTFLTEWLNSTPPGGPEGDNTRAFVLYALADGDMGELALTRALAARANSLDRDGQVYLVRAFQRLGQPGDAQPLLDTVTAAARQTSTTAHWELADTRQQESWVGMSTNTRTTALVLDALVAANKDDPLIPKTLRWLLTARQAGGAWATTQETAQALVALAHYLAASRELEANYTWTLSLNGGLWQQGTANADTLADTVTLRKAIGDLLINATNLVDLRRVGSQGKLYYNMSLRYYLPDEGIRGRSEGLSVVREYLQPGTGRGKTPPTLLTQATPGDLVQIRLTVIAPADAYYLVVEDPLPAGLEAVNGSLKTTTLTEQIITDAANTKGGIREYTPTYFDHMDMRDDRTVLFATYLPAGVYTYTYLARATTPGAYGVLPAHAYLSYFPDVFGRSDGGRFTVGGK